MKTSIIEKKWYVQYQGIGAKNRSSRLNMLIAKRLLKELYYYSPKMFNDIMDYYNLKQI